VKCGLTLPIFDERADPRVLADLAGEAEAAGWDGVFLWDHTYYRAPVRAVSDPWIALAAIASRTSTLTLGPLVTPLARRRPEVIARQLVALDQLSDGRMILGAGLGLDSSGGEFSRFGEELDLKVRAARYDEALTLLLQLLSGAPVDHRGVYFRATDVTFLPTPVHGRLPVWVAGRWPNRRPLQRAARYDGLVVIDVRPDELPSVRAAVAAERPQGLDGFEFVVQTRDWSERQAWEDAGATWCLATADPFAPDLPALRALIGNGPSAG
jgi:alkanesulfonate monooxygenase SsuD/methylene tetrahydromethanopterin reductase-like flavin-dependent oxidoreductase (luciferase family)